MGQTIRRVLTRIGVVMWVLLCGIAAFRIGGWYEYSPSASLLLMFISMLAAATMIAIVDVCPPRSTGIRLTVFACAVIAVFTPWTVAAVADMISYEGPALEVTTDPTFFTVGWRWAIGTCVAACAALPPFWIARQWVAQRRQLQRTGRIAFMGRLRTAGFVTAASLLGLLVADGIDGPDEPLVPRTMSSVSWQLVSDLSTGVQEEPIAVGILVLLWPRFRRRTFAAVLALSVAVRMSYYLSNAVDLKSLAALVLWCSVWSGISLVMMYRFRMLWPIVIANGLYTAHLTLCSTSRYGPQLPDALVVAWAGIPIVLGGLSFWYLYTEFSRKAGPVS